jgi:6-phosphogluconolactonase
MSHPSALGPSLAPAGRPDAYYVYVGCRTTRERNARGNGINVYRMDAHTGSWTHLQLLDGLLNPSFLAADQQQRTLYSVHGDSSEVSAFRIDGATGLISRLNQQSTQGRNPVHLAFDASERFLVVANHVTSSLAVLPVHDDGSLDELVDLAAVEGKIGPHRAEQPFPKPHQVVFDPSRRFMIIPDKGVDAVFTYRLEPMTGRLIIAEPGRVQAREGSGPRHAVFHPERPYAYVLNELDSTVVAYRYDPHTGALQPFQLLSSLPDTFVGDSRAAEIEISADGRFIYASNRGDDSVAVFEVSQESGRMTPVQFISSGGRTPRFFAIEPSGRFCYVANEESDTIRRFNRDQITGKLTATDDVTHTGSPVCILFKAAD